MEWIRSFDFSNPWILTTAYLAFCAIVFLRYLFFTGTYYIIFRRLFSKKYSDRLLVTKRPEKVQLHRELLLSIFSALIFGFVGLGMVILWQYGALCIYTEISLFPIWYIPLSLVLFLILHDTYYYWLHQWMHQSRWMRKFHMEHHKSVETTVLTSFAFHPIESVLQAVFLPVFTLLIPMNHVVLLFILTMMTISSVVNHAGVEVYFKEMNSGVSKYIIGATHHDEHHRNARKNFGLYFTFWDVLMKTGSGK